MNANNMHELDDTLRLLYWHELDADAPADPDKPCPDDCMVCHPE